MHVDALSDVLKTIRMTGAVFFRVSARAPWVAQQLPRETVLPMILPGAEHMISYHIVTEGQCFANVIGGESIALTAGQVIVFTRGDRHVMSSEPGMRAVPLTRFANDGVPENLPFTATFGSTGPITAKVVCGFLACDLSPFNPLLESLPSILVADGSRGDLPSLNELAQLAIEEASGKRPGGRTALGRLTELMFIEVVRQHIEGLPAEKITWLSGLRDAFVGRALTLMHGHPGRPWSLDGIAREIGLSRSEFAERFTDFVGVPPMQYLAKWRMQIAAGLLRQRVNIAAVAEEVGYSSEASFSRAFKKIVGVPPSLWRHRQGRPVSGSPAIDPMRTSA